MLLDRLEPAENSAILKVFSQIEIRIFYDSVVDIAKSPLGNSLRFRLVILGASRNHALDLALNEIHIQAFDQSTLASGHLSNGHARAVYIQRSLGKSAVRCARHNRFPYGRITFNIDGQIIYGCIAKAPENISNNSIIFNGDCSRSDMLFTGLGERAVSAGYRTVGINDIYTAALHGDPGILHIIRLSRCFLSAGRADQICDSSAFHRNLGGRQISFYPAADDGSILVLTLSFHLDPGIIIGRMAVQMDIGAAFVLFYGHWISIGIVRGYCSVAIGIGIGHHRNSGFHTALALDSQGFRQCREGRHAHYHRDRQHRRHDPLALSHIAFLLIYLGSKNQGSTALKDINLFISGTRFS